MQSLFWTVRNYFGFLKTVELGHHFHVLNMDGDVLYQQTASIVPLIWPAKEYDVVLQALSAYAITDVTVSADVTWIVDEPLRRVGIAKLPPHRSRSGVGSGELGTSIEISAMFPRVLDEPPHGFTVGVTNKPPAVLRLEVRWEKGIDVATADLLKEAAPRDFRESSYDPAGKAWRLVEHGNLQTAPNRSLWVRFVIPSPKSESVFRIVWMQ